MAARRGFMVQKLRIFLICLGAVLIIYGAIMLMFFGNMVYELCTHPERVELVNYILANIKKGGPMAYARTPQGEEMVFEVSETGKTFGFLVMGMMGLGVLAGVVRAMIWGGVEIIKVTLSPWQPGKKAQKTTAGSP